MKGSTKPSPLQRDGGWGEAKNTIRCFLRKRMDSRVCWN